MQSLQWKDHNPLLFRGAKDKTFVEIATKDERPFVWRLRADCRILWMDDGE